LKIGILALASLAIFASVSRAGELYRWVDAAGKVNYGDVLPPNAMQVEVKRFPEDTTSSEYLPYETLRAQQNFPVTLYVGESCGDLCAQARAMLNKRGIPFTEKSLKSKKDIETFKQLSGFDAFIPTLAVGKSYLKGFVESQWNGELDFAGYPKTASYRQRTAEPSVPAGTAGEARPAEEQTSGNRTMADQTKGDQSSADRASPAKPAEQ